MLKFVPKETYKTKATIFIPGDFGRPDKFSFTVEFRRLKQQDARQLLRRVEEAKSDPQEDQDLDAEVLRENLVGWSNLPGADGNDIPFSAEALDEMLEYPCYRSGLLDLFFQGFNNRQGQALKN